VETAKSSAVREDQMKALLWTISIMAFGLGGVVNHLTAMF
jgi:hypothetical protein